MTCYVYFIEGPNGFVKVGHSEEPERRLRKLQIGCPVRLIMRAKIKCESEPFAEQMERRIHKMFAKQKVRGEWFQISSNTISNIAGYIR